MTIGMKLKREKFASIILLLICLHPLSVASRKVSVHYSEAEKHRNLNCTFSPSCKDRRENVSYSDHLRLPCHCDDDCTKFGDCCFDAPALESEWNTQHDATWTCNALPRDPTNAFAEHKNIFMKSECPIKSWEQLKEKCTKKAQYTYMMDIPVVSDSSSIIYSNIYCAMCNNEGNNIAPVNAEIKSIHDESVCTNKDLNDYTYHPGELTWTKPGHPNCSLWVEIDEDSSRRCEVGIDSCKGHQCTTGKGVYYVEDWSNGLVYSSLKCAQCNGVSDDNIDCLLDKHLRFSPGSPIGIFVVENCCLENQFWNFMEQKCEDYTTPSGIDIFSKIVNCVSLICMALHVTIYILLPKRRNIPAMNLFCMTVCLFVANLLLLTTFRATSNEKACATFGVFLYYFLMATFLWMNVISFDISYAFTSKTVAYRSTKTFIYYSIYAFGVPLLLAIITAIVNATSNSAWSPKFGKCRCWFNEKNSQLLFFNAPALIVFVLNIVLYVMAVYSIYKQFKVGKFARSTVRKNSNTDKKDSVKDKEKEKFLQTDDSSNQNPKSPNIVNQIGKTIEDTFTFSKKQKMRLALYCKLAIIMGMTWIFAFFAVVFKSLVFEYLFIIFNGFQGTFIFLSFDCKKKIYSELRNKLSKHGMTTTSDVNSKSTKDTNLSKSLSSSGYRKSSTDGNIKRKSTVSSTNI